MHRIHALEEARDRMTSEISRLRDIIGVHEGRLVVSETMQPVILQTLAEIKAEILKSNAIWGRLAWVIVSAVILAVLAFVFKGGLVIASNLGG